MAACIEALSCRSTRVQDRFFIGSHNQLQRLSVRIVLCISHRVSLANNTLHWSFSFSTAAESRGQFVAAGRSAGNENRRWHGTRRECNVGDKGQTTMCSSNNCPMCSIIRNSFDLSRWGSKTGWGRLVDSVTLFRRTTVTVSHFTGSAKASILLRRRRSQFPFRPLVLR